MKIIKNLTKISLLALLAVSVNADYKLGKDYDLEETLVAGSETW